MRTHGSRQQQEAVRNVPSTQMQKIYEVKSQNFIKFPWILDFYICNCFLLSFSQKSNEIVYEQQALDTLGNTKWRVNKRLLNVVESIWAAGGDIAGLVNREDVSFFFSSNTDTFNDLESSLKSLKSCFFVHLKLETCVFYVIVGFGS